MDWSQWLYLSILAISVAFVWRGARLVSAVMCLNAAATVAASIWMRDAAFILVGVADVASAAVLAVYSRATFGRVISAIFAIMVLLYLAGDLGLAEYSTVFFFVDALAYLQILAMIGGGGGMARVDNRRLSGVRHPVGNGVSPKAGR